MPSGTRPSGRAGLTSTTSGTPATLAGTRVISAVDTSGASALGT
jgi:hypothetical protein